jgi:multiple sugar transport system permease protein
MGSVLIILLVFSPLYWLFVTSVSPQIDLLDSPPRWVPARLSLERYREVLGLQYSEDDVKPTLYGGLMKRTSGNFRRGLSNSVVVSFSTTFICLLIGILAAYAFWRFNFRFRDSLFFIIMTLQMIPYISYVIPLYFILSKIRLAGTAIGLIIAYLSTKLVYVIWTLMGYFKSISFELEEAALVDGCGRWKALWKVIVPVLIPGIIGSGILVFLLSWNEFMFALTFAGSGSAKTFPVVLSEFTTQYSVDYGLMATGAILGSIPPLVLALLFQKFLVSGLSGGAVKG